MCVCGTFCCCAHRALSDQEKLQKSVKLSSYTIFVDTFTEQRPGQTFKGKGDAQVLMRLLVGKQAVWKAACAKLKVRSCAWLRAI